MDAHCGEPDRPSHRADEIQAGPATGHGIDLCDSLGIERCQGWQAAVFLALITDPARRIDMIKDGWKSVGKVFVLAIVLDVVYQIVVLRFMYPGETIIVAFVLAIVPYLILRGLVTRLASRLAPKK
jgi:hypothetical protein